MINLECPGDFLGGIPWQEIEDSKKLIQKNNQSLFDHTAQVLNCLSERNQITILSAICHDLGKLTTRVTDNEGKILNFNGHEKESSRIAYWNLGTDTGITGSNKRKILSIVETHMVDLKCEWKPQAIRNFIAKIGIDNIDNWFTVKIADIFSYPNVAPWNIEYLVEPFREKVYKYLTDLSGADIIELAKSEDNIHITGV